MFDAEKERILQRVRKEKNPRRRLAAVLKTAGAVAACFALLVTASVFSPVLAENIPFIENIVAFLKQSGQARSSVISGGAVEDYVTPVAGQEDANFRVTEVYCDGTALVLGVAADVENVDEHVRVLGPKYTLKVNGDTVNTLGDGTAPDSYLYPISENTFAGVFVMNLRELNLTEAFEIELSAELIGIDTQHMVLENGGSSYTPQTYALPETYTPVTMTVEPDQTLQKTYEIQESAGDCTIEQLTISPAFTHADVQFADPGSYVYFLTDQDGQPLEQVKLLGTPDLSGTRPEKYYQAITKDTTAVTISVFHESDRINPVCTATVEVDGFDFERMDLRSSSPVLDKETFDNLQVFDSAERAGLKPTDMNFMEQPLVQDGKKFITLDLSITAESTDGGSSIEDEIASYENRNDSTRILGITNFASGIRGTLPSDWSTSEVHYFSDHMNGIYNYYHFAINAGETKVFTIGFFVDEVLLENGELLLPVNSGQGYIQILAMEPE